MAKKIPFSFKFLCLWFGFLSISSDLFSNIFQNVFLTGAKPLSLGNAYTAYSEDVYAFDFNAAGVADLAEKQFKTSFYNFFGMEDITSFILAAVIPYGYNTYGVKISGFGLKDVYMENKLTLLFSRAIFENLFIGFNINYFWINYNPKALNLPFIAESINSVGLDIGTIYIPTKDIRLGVSFLNINHPTFTTSYIYEEKIESETVFGILYRPFDVTSISLDYNLKMNIISFGIEIKTIDILDLRAGYSDGKPSIGVGISIKHFNVDFGILLHEHLGLLQNLTLIVRI